MVGGNGAGKTSVLESVHVVATTRSFRTSQIGDCLRRGDSVDPFTIAIDASPAVPGGVRNSLSLRWGAEGRDRWRDGKSVALADYLEVLPVVSWTAREDEILAGLPERRRRMLDGGVVAAQPKRLAVLSHYRRTLGQKRELLRRRQGGLDEWNALLASAAVEVIRLRADFVDRLAQRLTAALNRSGLGLPEVELRYGSSPPDGADGAEVVLARMEERREDERRLHRPLVGPHLDRLQILWQGVDVSRVASAGERKALGLLLAAAQAEELAAAGRAPLVLADDVDAELDLRALEAVWRVLATDRQVLASTNRAEVAERLEGVTVRQIDGGEMTAENGP